jgi:hypothetical protein
MVQTRRCAQLRGLLRLPTDMLLKIASHSCAPGLVVAAGKSVEARTALRKGTDAAERSRFGGIGLTVREAEQVLRTRFAHRVDDSDLATRQAAGRALKGKMICRAVEDDPEGAPENEEDWFQEDEASVFISSGLIIALIAYGADPNARSPEADERFTPLHNVAAYPTPDYAIEQARLLLAAGADINARCAPENTAGRSAFTWCFCIEKYGHSTDTALELAIYLISRGCDVVQGQADVQAACSHYDFDIRTLVEILEDEGAPANERVTNRLKGLITAKLEAAGSGENRFAALYESSDEEDDDVVVETLEDFVVRSGIAAIAGAEARAEAVEQRADALTELFHG